MSQTPDRPHETEDGRELPHPSAWFQPEVPESPAPVARTGPEGQRPERVPTAGPVGPTEPVAMPLVPPAQPDGVAAQPGYAQAGSGQGSSPTLPVPTWESRSTAYESGTHPGSWQPTSPAFPGPLPPYAVPGPDQRGASRAAPGARGLLVLAASVGLAAGLVGGGAGAFLVNRSTAPTVSSPLPAPQPGATLRPDGSIAKIAATALPSVVTIKISTAEGAGTGSGFVIDGAGHILTNNHVVSPAADGGTIAVELSDGTSVDATIVGRDASYDLAVLKVERAGLTPLAWGRSTEVVVGDGVIAVGAPLGLEATVTSGIISALDRPVVAGDGNESSFINAIQTDAAINPGNSGGPLLDMNGRVIGVNSAIARDPGSATGVSGSIGVGFAIPSDQAARTAEQLITTGKAVHPVIGVRLDGRFEGSGAKVLTPGGVTEGSAAATAGLQDGDVIVAFDGKRVADRNQLVVAIRARTVGETVTLTIERNGQRITLPLTLQSSGS